MIQKIRIAFLNNEILKKGSVSLIFKVLGSVIGYVFLLLVTRNLGAEKWGTFVLFLAILNIASIFGRLGIDILLLKLISTSSSIVDRVKNIYYSSIRLVLLFSLITSVILFYLSDFLALEILKDSSLINVIKWISYILPLFSVICVNENFFRGLKMIREFAFFQKASKMLLSVVFFLIFYYLIEVNSKNLVVLVFLYSIILIFILTSYLVYKKLILGSFSGFLKSNVILKQSIPMMMSSSVLLLMSWTDTLMIGSFMSQVDVGIYNVAVKIALLTSFTLNAVNSISAPKLSETFNNKKDKEFRNVVSQTTRTIFFSTIPIILLIFLFPNFLLSFFGEEFVVAKTALLFLAFSQVINAMSGSVGVILNMTGSEKVFRNILFIALIVNISLNFILIPMYGIVGAAIASASSLIFWNLYSVYFVYRRYDVLTFISFN